jgi:hypothetical protein
MCSKQERNVAPTIVVVMADLLDVSTVLVTAACDTAVPRAIRGSTPRTGRGTGITTLQAEDSETAVSSEATTVVTEATIAAFVAITVGAATSSIGVCESSDSQSLHAF